MTEEMDLQQSENAEGDTDTETEVVDEKSEAEIRAEKAESAFIDQKIRAEIAEKELKRLKALGKEKPSEQKESLGISAKDIIALRDVHEDDVDYLLEEAALRGKTVSELKKDPYMQIILRTKAEERKTAEATNTGGSKRSKTNSSDELLNKISKHEDMSNDELKKAASLIVEGMKKK